MAAVVRRIANTVIGMLRTIVVVSTREGRIVGAVLARRGQHARPG